MATSSALRVNPLTPTVGGEVLDVDLERLRDDPDLPGAVLEALEDHGVLVFRGLQLDDEMQVAFCRRMGELVTFPGMEIPEIWLITLDPEKNPMAEYLKATVGWHTDGTMDPIPAKATMLSAKVLSARGGETEFASTYRAYEDLGDDEKERIAGLRVFHSQMASQGGYLDPSDERHAAQLAKSREHPLVWTHESGRRSLVIGHSADHVIDMDLEEGRALLADLNARATRPERVYQHRWAPGDTVMWDNCGVVHRVQPYDASSRREMHRTTLVGQEAIR
jgi:alpha-ketoglutarate-dependent taurine dioxygenase